MEFTCKKCGNVQDTKPRFCDKCGSYFIDANDPLADREWKGVIRADGTVAEDAVATVTRGKTKSAGKVSKAGIVWGIIAIIVTSHVLLLNALSLLKHEEDYFMLGVFPFIFCVIAIKLAGGTPKKIAAILCLFTLILFVIDISLIW